MLRQLIDDPLYVVDERLVAEAILLRSQARAAVPGLLFRNERSSPAVDSFQFENEAPSFRLGARPRSRRLHH